MDAIDIPPESQKKLLELSRQTLENFLRGERNPELVDDPYLQTSEYGVFVSLHHKEGELRGCIGTCFPTRPLSETVIEMTEAAASRDRRMAPVNLAELLDLRIDLSILSPLRRVDDPLALEVGKHGLHVANAEHRGVLLPQVATQYEWDIQTFLEHTCIKAGLPKEAWRWSDTEVSSFTALIIEEPR